MIACGGTGAQALSPDGAPGPIETVSAAGLNASDYQVSAASDGAAIVAWSMAHGIMAQARSVTGALGPIQARSVPGARGRCPS